MHHLTIIVDDSVLRTRIVNHLIIASDEQFLTDRMLTLLVLIAGNNLGVDTRDLGQLNSTEDVRTIRTLNESLSRLGEHNLGTMDITLVAIFILQDAILQTLQSDGLAHIALLILIFNRNDFDTSRRDIEGNFRTLDNQNLAIDVVLILGFNLVTVGIQHFAFAGIGTLGLIHTSEQILVGTQCVTADNLSHLAGIQSEGHRTLNINLAANINLIRQAVGSTDIGMLIICGRILKNHIPVLRSGSEQMNRLIITARLELLSSFIEIYQFVRGRQTGLGRTNPAGDITLGSVQNIRVLINTEHKILLHICHKHISPFDLLISYKVPASLILTTQTDEIILGWI